MLRDIKDIYRLIHSKVRSAAVFTVHALGGHFVLTSLAELAVEESVPSSQVGIPGGSLEIMRDKEFGINVLLFRSRLRLLQHVLFLLHNSRLPRIILF